MTENAFLDKGIVLGYCFLLDPHFEECQRYVRTGSEDFYTTKQVEDIYEKKREELVSRHRNAIQSHISSLIGECSGTLTQEDVDCIVSELRQSSNPSRSFLTDFYAAKVGEPVKKVARQLRGIARDIEQLAEERKEELYPLLHEWARLSRYPDLHEKLAGLKRDDEEDFYVVLDAHDVASNLDGETDLATTNPADFGESGYRSEILEHTEIDNIELVFASRT
jgi:hypothetical protein